MNCVEVAKAIDSLTKWNNEVSHMEADRLLIEYMKTLGFGAKMVAEAWERANKRCVFWYA